VPGAVEQVEKRLSASWPNIKAARAEATKERQRLAEILADFGTSDAAIVVYGSLACGEWTSGSDVIDQSMDSLARPVFAEYDRFLAIINDKEKRERLETIKRDDAVHDRVVADARDVGRAFGQAIEAFFFDNTSRYAASIRTYGVF
jgi:hypothetical protein